MNQLSVLQSPRLLSLRNTPSKPNTPSKLTQGITPKILNETNSREASLTPRPTRSNKLNSTSTTTIEVTGDTVPEKENKAESCDGAYEFNAPRFHDFTKPVDNSLDQNADAWFGIVTLFFWNWLWNNRSILLLLLHPSDESGCR